MRKWEGKKMPERERKNKANYVKALARGRKRGGEDYKEDVKGERWKVSRKERGKRNSLSNGNRCNDQQYLQMAFYGSTIILWKQLVGRLDKHDINYTFWAAASLGIMT